MLEIVLNKWKKTFLIYLDKVIIYSNSVEDHKCHVHEILSTVAEAGTTIKLKKCTFFINKVEYLGPAIYLDKLEIENEHTFSLQQVKPQPLKANSVPSWRFITSTEDLSLNVRESTIHLINSSAKELNTS